MFQSFLNLICKRNRLPKTLYRQLLSQRIHPLFLTPADFIEHRATLMRQRYELGPLVVRVLSKLHQALLLKPIHCRLHPLTLAPEVPRNLRDRQSYRVDRAQDLPARTGNTQVANEVVTGLEQRPIQPERRKDDPCEFRACLRVPFTWLESHRQIYVIMTDLCQLRKFDAPLTAVTKAEWSRRSALISRLRVSSSKLGEFACAPSRRGYRVGGTPVQLSKNKNLRLVDRLQRDEPHPVVSKLKQLEFPNQVQPAR